MNKKSKKQISTEELKKALEFLKLKGEQVNATESSVEYKYVPGSYFSDNREYLESRQELFKELAK